MKKLYSLFAVAAITVSAYAQTTTVISEDFAAITSGNSTASSGSGTGWTGNANFPTVASAYQAGGAVRIGTSTLVGSITSKTVDLSTDGGNVKVTFDVKGWTTVEGDIKVTITGQTAQTVTYTAVMSGSFETKSVTFTGGVANSTVKIETTAKRAFIDNVKIETYDSSLAVGDVNAAKANFVKNTVVENSILFSSKADVQIVNMNGQVVKTASVNENTSLNVAELAKGTYIVTGNVNGKAASQKIIKK